MAVKKDFTFRKNSPDETSRLTQKQSKHLTNPDHNLMLRAINMICFDSPNNVLSMIRVVLEADNDDTPGICDGGDSLQ
ncbi:hypothetical protein DD237_001107 [Peronospora effusa]|uniref:Uncharacterized protein n=1 Tax=Peronospora effusa TaxID=542832 RepID=A0A425CJZ7_9STRA|nr:hypothetical protein DD237_001107 [Peronospora effusa]